MLACGLFNFHQPHLFYELELTPSDIFSAVGYLRYIEITHDPLLFSVAQGETLTQRDSHAVHYI